MYITPQPRFCEKRLGTLTQLYRQAWLKAKAVVSAANMAHKGLLLFGLCTA
jgi:hypothetical protein